MINKYSEKRIGTFFKTETFDIQLTKHNSNKILRRLIVKSFCNFNGCPQHSCLFSRFLCKWLLCDSELLTKITIDSMCRAEVPFNVMSSTLLSTFIVLRRKENLDSFTFRLFVGKIVFASDCISDITILLFLCFLYLAFPCTYFRCLLSLSFMNLVSTPVEKLCYSCSQYGLLECFAALCLNAYMFALSNW